MRVWALAGGRARATRRACGSAQVDNAHRCVVAQKALLARHHQRVTFGNAVGNFYTAWSADANFDLGALGYQAFAVDKYGGGNCGARWRTCCWPSNRAGG